MTCIDYMPTKTLCMRQMYMFASAVLWLEKLQETCAISSTEAEFMQAVLAGKGVKYGRHVLNGIGRTQNGPSPIREDNMAAIMMINQQRPTKRTRYNGSLSEGT